MAKKGNYLFIKTVNPYLVLPYSSDNTLKTTKQDKANHGIGMSIIDIIVNTYDDSQTITTDNNQFTHTVNLDLESKTVEY